MPPSTAELLRQRALALRGFAARLQRLQLMTLHLTAGPDTWVGPSPQQCADDLRRRRTILLDEAEQLISHARRLERIAAELDAQTAAPAGVR